MIDSVQNTRAAGYEAQKGEVMFCPHCGTVQDDHAAACQSCGLPLTGQTIDHPCPHCGAPTFAGARYCSACGTALAAAIEHEQNEATPLTLEDLPAWLRDESVSEHGELPEETMPVSLKTIPQAQEGEAGSMAQFSLLDESDLPQWLREFAENEPPTLTEQHPEAPVLPPPLIQQSWGTVSMPTITGIAMAAFEPLPADLLAVEPAEPVPAAPAEPAPPPARSSSRALRLFLLLVTIVIVLGIVGYMFLQMQRP